MPPKEFEMGTGYLYDMEGNCLGSFESIEEMKCETEENDIIKRYNDIGCTSFTFTINFGFLTKRQNHLCKYGKYRVRKKYMNKVLRMLKKNIRGLK